MKNVPKLDLSRKEHLEKFKELWEAGKIRIDDIFVTHKARLDEVKFWGYVEFGQELKDGLKVAIACKLRK